MGRVGRLKSKKCKACAKDFTPSRPMQSVCGPACAIKRVKQVRREDVKQTKERKEAIKGKPDLVKEAQTAFNAFIRWRDKDQSCICCGLPLIAGDVGGFYDCGHYRSTGSAPHLRFDERNAHAQRKQCNRWGAGRAVDYRIGLIARIGLEAVEALEADNKPRNYTHDELRAIKADYKEKLKQIKRG